MTGKHCEKCGECDCHGKLAAELDRANELIDQLLGRYSGLREAASRLDRAICDHLLPRMPKVSDRPEAFQAALNEMGNWLVAPSETENKRRAVLLGCTRALIALKNAMSSDTYGKKIETVARFIVEPAIDKLVKDWPQIKNEV